MTLPDLQHLSHQPLSPSSLTAQGTVTPGLQRDASIEMDFKEEYPPEYSRQSFGDSMFRDSYGNQDSRSGHQQEKRGDFYDPGAASMYETSLAQELSEAAAATGMVNHKFFHWLALHKPMRPFCSHLKDAMLFLAASPCS